MSEPIIVIENWEAREDALHEMAQFVRDVQATYSGLRGVPVIRMHPTTGAQAGIEQGEREHEGVRFRVEFHIPEPL